MVSAFTSDLFHALRGHAPYAVPVSTDATLWLMSVDAVAAAFVHGLTLSRPLPDDRTVTLPALRLALGDLVATVARHAGADPRLITYRPDSVIEAAFGAQPPLATPRADALGFRHDGTVGRLVAAALATIASTEGTAS